MNGFNIQSNGLVGTPGNDWQIAGTGDFNGDGKSDILWRQISGAVAIWLMNGFNIQSNGLIGRRERLANREGLTLPSVPGLWQLGIPRRRDELEEGNSKNRESHPEATLR